jgi:cysteine desulfurase
MRNANTCSRGNGLMQAVYLDNNSTSALKTDVLEAMLPFMAQQHGNATSNHSFGRVARTAVEHAREQVAAAVGAYANQIVFTASGTEANNFAVRGIASSLDPAQILVSSIEHPCVTRPTQALSRHGWQANSIKVDGDCNINLTHLKKQLIAPTSLVSAMLVNNETGAIQDILKVAEIAREHKAYVHTDAVQALGKIPVDFFALGVHAMTISSHKIGGPLGAGALVLDKRIDIQPLLYGGGQERGLRSGTENVAAIVGFGQACELAVKNLTAFDMHTDNLRQHLEIGLDKLSDKFKTLIFGRNSLRVPNTSFFAFEHVDGDTLVTALDKAGFAVASGSACSSNSGEPSHVLLAMGVPEDIARSAVRVSFGMNNTLEQVQHFLKTLEHEVARLKNLTAIAA